MTHADIPTVRKPERISHRICRELGKVERLMVRNGIRWTQKDPLKFAERILKVEEQQYVKEK